MAKNNQELINLINRLNAEWGKQANKVIYRLYDLLLHEGKIDAAIDVVRREFPEVFRLDNVHAALVEAAAYGYGIVPGVVAGEVKKEWARNLAESWDSSGMKLSEKLHGAEQKMHNMITDTVRQQMRRNAAWTDAARALYDGYEQGGDVVRAQDLPQYIKQVRKATLGDRKAIQTQKRALGNIVRLGRNGAPNKALRASYVQLVKAVQEGTEEQLEKAIQVAVNEKSRYVAERIVRTEMARAYADGFLRKAMDDEDVVAIRFKLGTRHPKFDICDLYAGADLYGLGKGVYPKDKVPPLPVHPHCLCRYVELYTGEVDLSKERNQTQTGGNKWLEGLSEARRAEVLGRAGLRAWNGGEDWRRIMSGYNGMKEPESRLADVQGRGHKSEITQKTIDHLNLFAFPGMTKQQNERMLLRHKELLSFAKEKNNHNEVAFILSEKLDVHDVIKGSENEVDFSNRMRMLLEGKNLQIIHNHPWGESFSTLDVIMLLEYNGLSGVSLITNKGHIETLQKTKQYDKIKAHNILTQSRQRLLSQNGLRKSDVVRIILLDLEREGLLVWKK